MEIRVDGRIGPGRLRSAISVAASRYPLARARLADSLFTDLRYGWEIADELEGVASEEVEGGQPPSRSFTARTHAFCAPALGCRSHEAALDGRDYDLARLLPFWRGTSEQDWALCERNHAGVRNPAFRPGPYSHRREYNVLAFVDWYLERLRGEAAGSPAPPARSAAAG